MMDKGDILRKMRLVPGQKLLIVNAPREFLVAVNPLDFDSVPREETRDYYDFVHVFAYSNEELEVLLNNVSGAGKHDCLFWVSYPKGSGPIKSDIRRNTVWEILEKFGLRCVTQVAIDETWSALRARPPEKIGK